jgi:hypothetical protein
MAGKEADCNAGSVAQMLNNKAGKEADCNAGSVAQMLNNKVGKEKDVKIYQGKLNTIATFY